MTDSGALRFATVTNETLLTAAKLREKNIEYAGIIRRTVTDTPYQVAKLTSRIILDSVFVPEEKFLYAIADLKLMKVYGVPVSETGGIVQKLNEIEEAETVAFLYEKGDGIFKCSLRSKELVDVSEIAAKLGGGGHIRAAAFETADYQAALASVRELAKSELRAKAAPENV